MAMESTLALGTAPADSENFSNQAREKRYRNRDESVFAGQQPMRKPSIWGFTNSYEKKEKQDNTRFDAEVRIIRQGAEEQKEAKNNYAVAKKSFAQAKKIATNAESRVSEAVEYALVARNQVDLIKHNNEYAINQIQVAEKHAFEAESDAAWLIRECEEAKELLMEAERCLEDAKKQAKESHNQTVCALSTTKGNYKFRVTSEKCKACPMFAKCEEKSIMLKDLKKRTNNFNNKARSLARRSAAAAKDMMNMSDSDNTKSLDDKMMYYLQTNEEITAYINFMRR